MAESDFLSMSTISSEPANAAIGKNSMDGIAEFAALPDSKSNSIIRTGNCYKQTLQLYIFFSRNLHRDSDFLSCFIEDFGNMNTSDVDFVPDNAILPTPMTSSIKSEPTDDNMNNNLWNGMAKLNAQPDSHSNSNIRTGNFYKHTIQLYILHIFFRHSYRDTIFFSCFG